MVVKLGVEELFGLLCVQGERDDVSVLVGLNVGHIVSLQDVLDLVSGVGGKGEDVLDLLDGKVLAVVRGPAMGAIR